MDAALKVMPAFGQAGDFKLAALENSRPRHCDARKPSCAFGDRGLSSIEPLDKTPAELLDLGEGVWLATLVNDA